MAATANPVEQILGQLLSAAGNLTLELDPVTPARLESLEGRRIRLEITGPGPVGTRSVGLAVRGGRLEVLPGDTTPANAIVHGSLPRIIGFLTSGAPAPRQAEDGLRIEGDAKVLSDMEELFRRYQPDLAGPVEQLVGKRAAEDLLGMAEAGIALFKSAGQSIGNIATATAQSSYVADSELDTMLNALEDLRLRIDRLAARTGLLESKRRAASGGE